MDVYRAAVTFFNSNVERWTFVCLLFIIILYCIVGYCVISVSKASNK